MRRSSAYAAVGLTAALLVLTPAGDAVAGAKRAKHAATCARHTEGALSVGALSVRSKGPRPFVLEQTSSYDADAAQWHVQAVVRQGQQLVLSLEQTVGNDGTASGVSRYGRGFKGVQEITFTKSGAAGQMIIDGRPTAPIVVGGDAKAVRFADGSALPRLRARASVKKALLKVARQAAVGCAEDTEATAVSQAAPVQGVAGSSAGRPEGSFNCKKCEGKCAGEWMACVVATFTNPYGAAIASGLSFLGAGKPTCFQFSVGCLDDCHNKEGEACCPIKCDGHCFEEGATCCGAAGCAAGERCADSAIGVCCPAGTGDICSGGCCPQGYRCDRSGLACCPNGSGDFCGSKLGCCGAGQRCYGAVDEETGDVLGEVCCDHEPCGYNTCCAAGDICVAPDLCAKPNEVCSNGSYCPSPGICLPNGTCCQGGQVCGDQCCNAFGSSCCNGQCCDGACIAGACCPTKNACGPSCCPDGYACTDPTAGTCVPCEAGEDACPFSPGRPVTCCPSGQDCCVDGCCAAGFQCCKPPGTSQVGCFRSFECVS